MIPSIQTDDLDIYNNHSTPSTNSNEERSDEPPWEKLCGANSIWFEARSADEPLDTLVFGGGLSCALREDASICIEAKRSITYTYLCAVQHRSQYNQIHLIKVQHIYKLGLEEVRYSVHAVLLAKVPILPLATSGIL